MSTSPARRVRWWPAYIIVALAGAAVVFFWTQPDQIRQMRVLHTMLTGIAATLLLLIWLLLFSRLPGRARLIWLAALLGLGIAIRASVRVAGVSGDLVPVLSWRWSGQPAPSTASPAARPAATRAIHRDWPQFLGPGRDGVVAGARLARDWAAHPPREIWRRPVGPAWSSFAVVAGLAVTQEQDGDDEAVVARDLRTGAEQWRATDPARYETTLGGVGPRATPTIDGASVYTLGATGVLNAFELETGVRRWTRQIADDNGAEMPPWGYSGSPLVLDGHVIVSAGGPDGRSLVAYDAVDGAPVWAGGDDGAAYASPLITTVAGRRQIVIFNVASVAGHDPQTGASLWTFPWSGDQPNVAQPVALPDDHLLVTSGYGVGVKLLRLGREIESDWTIDIVWETRRLKSKFANVVVHEEFIYGLDDGVLVCLDPTTGERRWKSGRYGHGQILLVGPLILVQAESGEVAIVDAKPDGFHELGRIEALTSRTWNNPAFAAPYLLVRNDREAVCYEMPLSSPDS